MNQVHDLNNVIIFDGVCVLCNSLVDFLIKKDTDHSFKFLTAQSSLGQRLMDTAGIEPSLQTGEFRLIFFDDNKHYLDTCFSIRNKILLPDGF